MHDIAEFLRRLAPFDGLNEGELEKITAAVEVEYFAPGATIVRQGEPVAAVWVIRRGEVELVHEGRVVDLLEEGELLGQEALILGQPAGVEARSPEGTLCYRFPPDAVTPVLSRPAGFRFLVRNLLARQVGSPAVTPMFDPLGQPVGELVGGAPLICAPETSLRDCARMMTKAGGAAALVRLGYGGVGILTDSDIRSVVSEGQPLDAPVTEAMTAPAFTVSPARRASEAMLEMLERGVRHLPVVSARGETLGVLSDTDLLVAEAHTPFALRHLIDRADDAGDLTAVAGRLRPAVVSLHDAGAAPLHIASVISVIADSLAARFAELAVRDLGPPPGALSWLALGSQGRREMSPSSDMDSALAWGSDLPDEGPDVKYMNDLAARVVASLQESGFAPDAHGASAAKPVFARSVTNWRTLIRYAIDNPREDKALVVISLLCDGRAIYQHGVHVSPLDELRSAQHRRGLLRLMLRQALVHRPPAGFLRRIVVEHSGEHRGHLDIKHGGLLTVTSIARYAGLAAGGGATSTIERLREAEAADTLTGGTARTLGEAFELFLGLRLEHQVEQIRNGDEPDDFIDPARLNPLTRSYLRDAFSAVRSVQKDLGRQLGDEVAFG